MPPRKVYNKQNKSLTNNSCLFVDDSANTVKQVETEDAQEKQQQQHIQLDNREHGLIELIHTVHPPRALHVGDIWIGISGEQPAAGGLIIERKTWGDLEASVMDGRYREQRGRLLAFSEETGARVVYIIEKSKLRNFSYESVQKFIARLQLVHGITVFETGGIQGTADLVPTLAAVWEKDPDTAFKSAATAQRAADGIHVVKRDNDSDPRLFVLKILCLCPGISSTVAEAIMTAHDNSFEKIMQSAAKTIAAIKVPTKTGKERAIGSKIAERLYGLLHNNPSE